MVVQGETPAMRHAAALHNLRLWVRRLDATPADRINEQTTCIEEIERCARELLAASKEWK
jgi:hypothetical protein